MHYPRISIIILNWNRWEETIDCLKSLQSISYSNYDIVLVDNASKNNSIEEILKYASQRQNSSDQIEKNNLGPISIANISFCNETFHHENMSYETKSNCSNLIYLIRNDVNYGFAKGNNIAIKFALDFLNPDYVLLLNNDTIVDKKFLSKLVEKIESDSCIGFIGPKIYYFDCRGRKDVFNYAGGTFGIWTARPRLIGLWEIDKGQYDDSRYVDYVAGSCLLIKTSVLKIIGLLDDNFFAYWEENDLCWRGKLKGYKSFYEPNSVIWHKESASVQSDLKTYLLARNRILFVRKHSTALQKVVFCTYFFCYNFWVTLLSLVLRTKDIHRVKPFLRGVKDGLLNNPVSISR